MTILGLTQTADGALKLIAAEGESIAGPTFRIGNTNSRIRFSQGPAAFIDAWCAEGPTHHVALGVGHQLVADAQGRRPARPRARGGRVSVRFLGPDTDAYVASVERHAAEFEEQTGLELEIEIVPSDLYFSNRIHHLLDGDGAADVYMSGPVLVWEHLAAGFVQPLDEFLGAGDGVRRRGLLRAAASRCNRWSGRFGDALGEGPLLEIPVNCESYNLAYVPALLEEAGVDVPATWEQYFAPRGRSRARVAASRSAAPTPGTRCTPGTRPSSGRTARPTSRTAAARSPRPPRSGRPRTSSPHSRDAGPADWANQRWYELALDFARGRYGLIVDSDHYVAYFEDPASSGLVGEIGYAPPPLGPTGARRPNLWTWSVVMNSRTRDSESAWRFIEWATGREFLLRSAFEGNMNPTRTSVWEDESFRAHTSGWGAFYDVARTLVERDAFVLVTPASNYLSIAQRWVEALLDIYAGAGTAEALEQAAAAIDELVATP